MHNINKIIGREILDSRGNPTLEVEMHSAHLKAIVSIPSGASTGKYEALELRDNDKKRYFGKGVLKSIQNIDTIKKKYLLGVDIQNTSQEEFDKILIDLDGTDNKSKLGANTILGLSLAFLKLKAMVHNLHLFEYIRAITPSNPNLNIKKFILPTPMINILNGGMHADSGLEIQEFMIIPHNFHLFKEAIRCGSEIFHTLKNLLKEKNYKISVGDEGGFAPKLKNNAEALELITQAISKAGYKPKDDVFIALDCAASEFFKDQKYEIKLKDKKEILSNKELAEYYKVLISKYPIISIEDGFDEDDFEGFAYFQKLMNNKIQNMGDDLFVTNINRIQKGFDINSCNSCLIKLNQIGSVSKTLEAVNLCLDHKWTAIFSHRSGETEDTYLADFAIGTLVGQIKTGSMCRSERIAKYNQIIRIEEYLKNNGIFIGKEVFYNINNEK